MHTWNNTQAKDGGAWSSIVWGVPYEYISTQTPAKVSDLRAKYDVIVFGRAAAAAIPPASQRNAM